MWADVFGYTGKKRVVRYQTLNTTGGEAVEIATAVNCFSAAVPHKEWLCGVGAFFKISLKPLCGIGANENGPVFLALTAHHEFAPFEVYVFPVEANEF